MPLSLSEASSNSLCATLVRYRAPDWSYLYNASRTGTGSSDTCAQYLSFSGKIISTLLVGLHSSQGVASLLSKEDAISLSPYRFTSGQAAPWNISETPMRERMYEPLSVLYNLNSIQRYEPRLQDEDSARSLPLNCRVRDPSFTSYTI